MIFQYILAITISVTDLKKSEICPDLEPNLASNAKKYHKKGQNSVILNDKNAKKLHNLHMAITHLNPQLWTLIYNSFAKIPDLRQTGITENLATFGQFFIVLEPIRDLKATLCQRVSQSEKNANTLRQTDKHFRIYISRDCRLSEYSKLILRTRTLWKVGSIQTSL